jgi:predicted MPP superfamily phosphohydrolase
MLALAILIWGYFNATSDPVVRTARVALAGWPAGTAPVRAVLISDIHVSGPDTPPERLEQIVLQINDLAPDLVLIAGDFVSDKAVATHIYGADEAAAPLRHLRARLGTFAVLGNHDHWRDGPAIERALRQAGVRLLDNGAAQAGPLVLAGLGDVYTRNMDAEQALAAAKRLEGPTIVLSHSPDPFAKLQGRVPLMLAGHTHCGQIAPPLIGPLATASAHGRRYACGIVREGGSMLIVTAGLGTSILPLRFGAVPDLWLIELGPVREGAGR